MDKKRKAYAPFSLTSEAGVAQTPVEGYIDVNQSIYPTVNTGTINENGKWAGVKSSDNEFLGLSKAVSLPDGENEFFPNTGPDPQTIDMSGFSVFQFAIKPSQAGNHLFTAVQGPSTSNILNLTPPNALESLLILDPNGSTFENVMSDTQSLTADVWSVFTITDPRLKGQTNFKIRVRNNTGSAEDVEFAFRRIV
jgi:hypothetical protein